MEIGHYRRHASHVVGVSVGERHDVELMKPSRPQVGRHYILPDIQLRVHPRRDTAGIDQERAALWRNQKDRIALADVDSGEFEYSWPHLRMRRDGADPKSAKS